MSLVIKSRTKIFWNRHKSFLTITLGMILLLVFSGSALADNNESTTHFKMLSVFEYSGRGQFSNQAEMLFVVRKQSLPDNKTKYLISTKDFELVEVKQDSARKSFLKPLSFIVDRGSQHISEGGKDLALSEMVNNRCVESLGTTTEKNIGKTWKQSFSLPSLEELLAKDLKFTLTAIELNTEVFGKVTAVRALSEPFVVKGTSEEGEVGIVQSKIGAVYLFDPKIEEIYVSLSVFEATTFINGFKETLRHEMATYRSDSTGASNDLRGLGKDFEAFAGKLGLKTKSTKVLKESSLPVWVRYEGSASCQIADICAALACEGAVNPVVTIFVPAARTVALQGAGKIGTAGGAEAVSIWLASNVSGVGRIDGTIPVGEQGFWTLRNIAIIGGVTGGVIAVSGGGGGGGGGAATPTTP